VALLLEVRVPEIKLHTPNFEIRGSKGTSHTNSDSEWGNESCVWQISPKNKPKSLVI
jgi:hypothetical protein